MKNQDFNQFSMGRRVSGSGGRNSCLVLFHFFGRLSRLFTAVGLQQLGPACFLPMAKWLGMHRFSKLPAFWWWAIAMLVFSPVGLWAQVKPVSAPALSFAADFRFRLEQDWNSRKSDGTFRDDRTRLRYRWRAGVQYRGSWYQVGFRLRTGDPRKQQDPQLTLGSGFAEFGLLPIGLEKAYFRGEWSGFGFWLGKNTFPFEKSNELFWSDNVYPEGFFLWKGLGTKNDLVDTVQLNLGHFILLASGKALEQDAYFQGAQVYTSFLGGRLEWFPAVYLFRNVPDIPDGGGSFTMDYSILHFGSRISLLKKKWLHLELDYYHNFSNYNRNDSVPVNLRDQKSGVVFGLGLGSLKHKRDWLFKFSYAYLQRYSAVDFMAQNDWARWDYSSFGSPDGRLTNFKGIEVVVGYAIDKRAVLKTKFYLVEQLVPYGIEKETGSRIRFDLDVKF